MCMPVSSSSSPTASHVLAVGCPLREMVTISSSSSPLPLLFLSSSSPLSFPSLLFLFLFLSSSSPYLTPHVPLPFFILSLSSSSSSSSSLHPLPIFLFSSVPSTLHESEPQQPTSPPSPSRWLHAHDVQHAKLQTRVVLDLWHSLEQTVPVNTLVWLALPLPHPCHTPNSLTGGQI